ncbi:MAG TPA: MBL fold metallo-hydrolase [Steroidobacteraceae bacterium]|nr:MBL fold metallo-hydrolase [Steroidobacteraceae bacterium]
MKRLMRPVSAVLAGIYASRRSMTGGPGYRGPRSDHFDGEVFRNPSAGAGKSFAEFWRWQRTRKPKQWPTWIENRACPDIGRSPAAGETALTFVNHITFLIQYPGLNVLTDPVYSDRVSPVPWAGPRRVRAPGIAFEALPPIDLVLVSHNHYDHLDLATLRRLDESHVPRVVTGLGNAAFLTAHGVRNVIELDWWQHTVVGGAEITFIPAQHWSGRGLRGRNRTLWGGFVVRAGAGSLCFAGDTGYSSHFTEIARRLGRPDVALLPIGAYAPRWFMQEQHMDPDDAVRAHLDLGAKLSIATHFGCFQLTDEGFDDPVTELATALARRSVPAERFAVLEVGETLRVHGAIGQRSGQPVEPVARARPGDARAPQLKSAGSGSRNPIVSRRS